MKTYNELTTYTTFEDKLNYLYIGDKIGHETFGNARWLNQRLYKSAEWRRVRDRIILRDGGCDLGVEGCGLSNRNILIHHINPITEEDIVNMKPCLFDEDNLISTSRQTHNFIHYGSGDIITSVERAPNDTCPWKNERR